MMVFALDVYLGFNEHASRLQIIIVDLVPCVTYGHRLDWSELS